MPQRKMRIDHMSGPTATIQNTPPLVTSNKARARHEILVQMTTHPSPELSDVPTIASYAKDMLMKRAIELLVSPGAAGRTFAAPPNIPPARLAILRGAFDAAVADSEFLATRKKARLDVDTRPGVQIESFHGRAYQAGPADIDLARRLIESNGP